MNRPPFYAPWVPDLDRPMRIFGGLLTDDRLQAVHAAGKTIAGLYPAGKTVGGRFKQAYPPPYPGISRGVATTMGYLAAGFAIGLT